MDVHGVADAIGVTVVERLPRGEGAGAYVVRTAGGAEAVLKVGTGTAADAGIARALVSALRARGYPAPALLDHGAVEGLGYELTELVRGDPAETVTPALVPELVHLVDLQRDVGLPGRAPWIEDIVTSVTDGRSGYCEHGALQAHDPALLDRLRAIAGGSATVDAPVDDAVHYDFSPFNILVSGDRVTGVVDWQGATSGDAAFDLVTCAYYTFDPTVHRAPRRRPVAYRSTRAPPVRRAHGAAAGRLVVAQSRPRRGAVVHRRRFGAARRGRRAPVRRRNAG